MAAQGSNLLGRRVFMITDIPDLKRGLVDAAMELMQLYTSSLRPDMKVGLWDRRTVENQTNRPFQHEPLLLLSRCCVLKSASWAFLAHYDHSLLSAFRMMC